ncbi:MAG: MBOAT family protein [Clostridia bacterium]|nr:MBOAT family protein [Clostridia bacterium]
MAFQTFSYFVFLAVMMAGYFVLPVRMRWALLLAGSYFFYMCWNASYALLMLLSTAVTYLCGVMLGRVQTLKAKKGCVAASLVINLSILFFFKYYGLLSGTLNGLPGGFVHLPEINVLLPVGISFYIFQALGYTIDVYRGDIEPVRHFGKYALFVSFFPQLVAGPIERSGNLIKQFDEVHRPDFESMRRGAVMILLGLIKKLVIADRLAVFTDHVYADAAAYGAPAVIAATVCFAFQIYCDFSGYSDLAIGSASLLGFRLMKNFDRPYFSRSIGEFWRRWHISLSSWFRDYLYFPLGGSRVNAGRWAFNILLVFLVSGLWHGAAWTFAAWGLLNGVYQVVGRFTKNGRDALWKAAGVNPDGRFRACVATAVTFALTLLAWMVFRADSFMQLWTLLGRLVSGWEFESLLLLIHQVNGRECLMMALLVAALLAAEWPKSDVTERILTLPAWARWSLSLALLFVLILFGKYNESPAFIYFQF